MGWIIMITRIESTQNPRVKQWKKLQTKKERNKTGLFLIEGLHLIEEALKYKAYVKELIVREGTEYSLLDARDIDIFEVTEDIMNTISDTETPQGIAAVCGMKGPTPINIATAKLLLIDNVQDPGNLGTMIRTADAVGMDAVILGEGCVDLYNGKVIRATQGSLFHIPIMDGNLDVWIKRLNVIGVPVFGTALEGARNFKEIEPQKHFALLVGNEGNGVDPKLLKLTDENLYIPIYGQAESLNVSIATGILLYHLRG